MSEIGTRPSDPEYISDLEGKYAALSVAHVRLLYYYRRLEQRVAQRELELALDREATEFNDGSAQRDYASGHA